MRQYSVQGAGSTACMVYLLVACRRIEYRDERVNVFVACRRIEYRDERVYVFVACRRIEHRDERVYVFVACRRIEYRDERVYVFVACRRHPVQGCRGGSICAVQGESSTACGVHVAGCSLCVYHLSQHDGD